MYVTQSKCTHTNCTHRLSVNTWTKFYTQTKWTYKLSHKCRHGLKIHYD